MESWPWPERIALISARNLWGRASMPPPTSAWRRIAATLPLCSLSFCRVAESPARASSEMPSSPTSASLRWASAV
eukprot:10672543-Alexandrium_andersonii.AAC.1